MTRFAQRSRIHVRGQCRKLRGRATTFPKSTKFQGILETSASPTVASSLKAFEVPVLHGAERLRWAGASCADFQPPARPSLDSKSSSPSPRISTPPFSSPSSPQPGAFAGFSRRSGFCGCELFERGVRVFPRVLLTASWSCACSEAQQG